MIFNTSYVYTSRETKSEFVYQKYREILKGKILDIGADECHLKNHLSSNVEYVGIGLGNNPDLIKVDLEKDKIPFPDNSFDCVLCLDVLEHLENIHEMFDEICRVSQKWVVISLPNPYSDLMNYFRLGRYKGGPKNMKFYGLPLEREPDRHKWFFSSIEAREFVEYRAIKNNMSIVDVYIQGKGHDGLFKAKSWREKFKLKKIIEYRNYMFRKGFDFHEIYESISWWVLKKE